MIDGRIKYDSKILSLLDEIKSYHYVKGEEKMSYTGIVKHVDEDITWEEITRRVGLILDGGEYPFEIDAITIEPTGFMWGDKKKAYKKGFRIAVAENIPIIKLGALCYALNQSFKGAHCTVTSGDTTFSVIYGRTDVEKTDEE